MTLVFAHRGFAAQYPENTMLSFRKAWEAGADGIELDVHLSEDGHVVVIHDRTVDRTTNGSGLVKEFTLFELQELHKPQKVLQKELEQIPSLEEVLKWIIPTGLFLNIELKNKNFQYPELEEKVITLLRQFEMEKRTILSSFNHYSLAKCQKLEPEIEVAPLYEADLYEPWHYAKTFGATALHPELQFAHKEIIEQAHEKGIAVRPWTVNEKKDMLYFFEADCVAILTDEVEKAVQTRDRFIKLYRDGEENKQPLTVPTEPTVKTKKQPEPEPPFTRENLFAEPEVKPVTRNPQGVSKRSNRSTLLRENRSESLPSFDKPIQKPRATRGKGAIPSIAQPTNKRLTEKLPPPKKQEAKREIPSWLGHPEVMEAKKASAKSAFSRDVQSSEPEKKERTGHGQSQSEQQPLSRVARKKK